jgi:uncharacterized protein (UPF0332 family)
MRGGRVGRVSDSEDQLLKRARTELRAAHTLDSAGFSDQATSRAYYGAFYAAESALLVLGETRSKHSGVISAFGRLVVKDGGFDPELASELRRLFELRNAADYSWLDAQPAEEDDDSIDAAERFVAGVERWVENRRQR